MAKQSSFHPLNAAVFIKEMERLPCLVKAWNLMYRTQGKTQAASG
jgi:hypothetical protein